MPRRRHSIQKSTVHKSPYKVSRALVNAISNNSIGTVQNLLNAGVEIHGRYRGMTLLHFAISKNRIQIAKMLIRANASLLERYKEMTPLHMAIAHGAVEICKAIIDISNDLETPHKQMTPLHFSIEEGQFDIAHCLIQAGANIESLYDGQTPLHAAILGGHMDIAKLLIDKKANLEAIYQNKSPLHSAIFEDQLEIVTDLIEAGANTEQLYRGKTALHYAIYKGRVDIAKLLIELDANLETKYDGLTPLQHSLSYGDNDGIAHELIRKGVNLEVPFEILKRVSNRTLIKDLFRNVTFYGCRLDAIVKNMRHFRLVKHRRQFLKSNDPIEYLEINTMCSPVVIESLKILRGAYKIKKYEKSLLSGSENAMDDSKVALSNWHFKNKVKSHFHDNLLSYSDNQNEFEAIENVHQLIRELLLDEILRQANEDNNHLIINFVHQNREKLLKGEPGAMKASCGVFVSPTEISQAAWRGFNPYAPVSGEWPNLLTPPLSNKRVWTTSIDNDNGKVDAQKAYRTLQKRIAYYYLAVIDKNDGDDEVRQTRMTNFIAKLAEIRNSHKLDDPSCYPGTITRIAAMGAFHSVAQLPNTTKDTIENYIKVKAIALFQERMSAAPDYECEHLNLALTELTAENAIDVITHPERYQPEWLPIRQSFISSLGTSEVNIVDISVDNDSIPLVDKDLVYVDQSLLDICQGSTGLAIAEIYNRCTDVEPTDQERQAANPFCEISHPIAHQICARILSILSTDSMEIWNSRRNLNNVSDYLKSKVSSVLEGDSPDSVVVGLEISDVAKLKITDLIKQLRSKSSIVNPFDKLVIVAEAQLGNYKTNPVFRKPMENRLQSLIAMQALFKEYLPIVQEAFVSYEIELPCLVQLTESLVNYIHKLEENFDVSEFSAQLDETVQLYLENNPQSLESLINTLTEKFKLTGLNLKKATKSSRLS